MANKTLSELRDDARRKADEKEVDFITNPDLLSFINQGAKLIYGKIAQRFNDDLTVHGTALNGGLFSTVIGTPNYAWPTSMKKLVRAETRFNGSTSDNDWRKLKRLNIGQDHGDYCAPIPDGYSPRFGYFPTRDYLWLKPVPTQVFQVRLWFVPKFTPLSADSDTPITPDEYDDLISEFAAIQALRTSGEPIYKESMEIFNLELNNMLDNVNFRDHEPEQMVITDDDFECEGYVV